MPVNYKDINHDFDWNEWNRNFWGKECERMTKEAHQKRKHKRQKRVFLKPKDRF